MVSGVVSAIATGIGLLTDKYMLEATNFVEHYAVQMKPDDHQKEFIKSAMYAGAIAGMVTFGPLSDVIGRRAGLITCSVVTSAGALLSMCAWDANALIFARIITGIGMGGEYPLASTHSCESAKSADDGARNVALLYLFGSGGGPVLCDLVAYFLAISGLPSPLVWRGIFAVGTLLSIIGLVLRIKTTKNSKSFEKSAKKAKGVRRKFFKYYWQPLLGTALIWLLFDIVEYGLKQNDAAIFSAGLDAPYSASIMTVMLTRLLVIPSLAFAPWLLKQMPTKYVQMLGFAGCCAANLALALGYDSLKEMTILFAALYIIQLSFQSLPGVSTMAISAEIYPCAVKGTAAAISAASGKVGAVFGSYYFPSLKNHDQFNLIFWVVTGTSTAALILTMILTPLYNGATIEKAEALAVEGEVRAARRMLYSGPQKKGKDFQVSDDSNEESSEQSSDDVDAEAAADTRG